MILKNNDFKKYFVFRFPSFRFFPIPKIENLEISENCLLLQILTAVLIQHFVQLVVDKIALVFYSSCIFCNFLLIHKKL